jgi:hypothetical protein
MKVVPRNPLVMFILSFLLLGALGTPAIAQTPSGELRLGMQYDHGTFDPQVLTTVGDKQMSVNRLPPTGNTVRMGSSGPSTFVKAYSSTMGMVNSPPRMWFFPSNGSLALS